LNLGTLDFSSVLKWGQDGSYGGTLDMLLFTAGAEPLPSFAEACFLEDFPNACAFKWGCLEALEEFPGGDCPVSSEEVGIQLVFLGWLFASACPRIFDVLAGTTGKDRQLMSPGKRIRWGERETE